MTASKQFALFITTPSFPQIRRKQNSPVSSRPSPKNVRWQEASCEKRIGISKPTYDKEESFFQSLDCQDSEYGDAGDDMTASGYHKKSSRRKSFLFTSSMLGGRKEKLPKEKPTRRATADDNSGTSSQTPTRSLMQKHLIARILDSQRMGKEKGKQQENFNLSKSLNSATIIGDTTNSDFKGTREKVTERKVSPLAKENSYLCASRHINKGLWCEQEHVIQSGVLDKLSDKEKQLQEALFEVITSEENYLKALEIMIGHFKASLECRSTKQIGKAQLSSFSHISPQDGPKSEGVLKKYEIEMLFCNIEMIRDLSRQLVSKYDSIQGSQALVQNYLDFFADFVDSSLRKTVVKYCSNINHQREVFQHLMRNNSEFAEKISDLENQKVTDRTFSSFLIAPMTRVCHMPLLIEKILKIGENLSSNYAIEINKSAKKALEVVQDVAFQCNQETSKLEDYAQKQKVLLAIEKTLLIPLDIKLNLITASRTLLCECNALQVLPSTNLFKNNIEVKLHFKLFHDILLICKPANDMFEVLDVADVGSGSVFLSELTKENEDHFLSRAKFLNPSQIQKRPISLVFFRTKVGDAPKFKKPKTQPSGLLRATHEVKTTSQSFQDNENVFIIQPPQKRNLFVTKMRSCLSFAEKRNSLDVSTRKFSACRRTSLKEDMKSVTGAYNADGNSTSSKFEVEHIDGSTVYLSLSSSTDYLGEDTEVVPFSTNSAFSPLYLQDIGNLDTKR